MRGVVAGPRSLALLNDEVLEETLAEDRAAGDVLVAGLWDIVEEWSSTAIQRTREAAATGPTDVLDAEIRLLIAHAARLRGAIEGHLQAVDSEPQPSPVTFAPTAESVAEPAPSSEFLTLLHEAPRARVCPECFTMVRLDEIETHELVCVRHKHIEKMERTLEGSLEVDVPEAAEAEPDTEADPDGEPAAADVDARPEAGEEPGPAAATDTVAAPAPQATAAPVADHTCNSADFERPLCDNCGGLHWYCSICGAQRDDCRVSSAAG